MIVNNSSVLRKFLSNTVWQIGTQNMFGKENIGGLSISTKEIKMKQKAGK